VPVSGQIRETVGAGWTYAPLGGTHVGDEWKGVGNGLENALILGRKMARSGKCPSGVVLP
jgi:hypothetical protein